MNAVHPIQALAELADFAASTQATMIPKEIQAHAALVMLDTLGVIMAGGREPELSDAGDQIIGETGGSEATVFFGSMPKTDAWRASLLNGTAGTALELDEGARPVGHPAIHVLPAALAEAEARGASGEEFLTAFVVGYQVTARILDVITLHAEVHPHGHVGTIGAAAAVGKLRGLSRDRILEAMNVAATLPLAASWQACFEGATARNAFTGVSNCLGLIATSLASAGVRGMWDGPGQGNVLGELRESPISAWPRNPGAAPFRIEDNYFKFFACCAGNHPGLDAARKLRSKLGRAVEPREVESVTVRTTDRFRAITAVGRPDNSLASRFALPFALGSMLLQSEEPGLIFFPGNPKNEILQVFSERIRVLADPAMTAAYPAAAMARVEIRFADGRVISETCQNPRGGPGNPASTNEILGKFTQLTHPLFGNQAAATAKHILEIETADRVDRWVETIREKIGGG